MNTYIARQPILDSKNRIFAYELLFRSNAEEKLFTNNTSGDQASSRIVMESFHTAGLNSITGGRPAFINFTASLLLEGIATLFPKNLLVIELLESIEPTPDIIKVCQELTANGYTIALDDFIYRPELDPLIELCQIIKFDFLACTPSEIAGMLSRINVSGKLLLAEKIETLELFNEAEKMGFSLFQGYYFSKPITLATKEIVPLKVNYISLLKEMNTGREINFVKLAGIIQNDVALSYKLLRMVNSSYYGMRSKISDIRHALSILGTKEIRKWAYLMSLVGLSSDKPDELIKLSMIRGRLMEQIGIECRLPYSNENMFMTGLFSLIDVLLNQPIESVLSAIKLSPEVYGALVDKTGIQYELLCLINFFERGDWDETDRLAVSLGLSMEQITHHYLDAVKWCEDISALV